MQRGRRDDGVEWPTVVLAVAIYVSWLALVLGHRAMPWWLTMALLGVVIAWHGSLQHEVVHGHPFRHRAANDALGSIPLSPRVPYLAYRRYHLRHHDSVSLTDPIADVESYYLTAATWDRMPPIVRWGWIFHQTLVGRLLLGPPCEIVSVWSSHAREIRRGDRELAVAWLVHLVGFGAVSWFALGAAGLPWPVFLGAIYAGHSLGLVRSFAEHRWTPGDASRSAVVRSGPVFSLLFLNNNLHHTHHARPGAPWYRLPVLAVELGSDQAATDGAGRYDGYLDVARRHLVRPIDSVVHPDHRALASDRSDGRAVA